MARRPHTWRSPLPSKTTLTTEQWVERARALAPIVEQHRDEGEQLRRLPDAVFEALRDGDFLNLWVPHVYGGHDVDMVSYMKIIEELARLDGAVGWNALIASQGGAILSRYPKAVFERLQAEGAVGAGSIAPTGRAEVVEGGFTLTGRWPLASGCHHATWMVAVGIVTRDGQPEVTPAGMPDLRLLLFPKSDCQILDTWYSSGLRGTGSNHFEVSGIFVPEAYSIPLLTIPEDAPGNYGRATLPTILAPLLSAVSLGIARDAIESFIELAQQKTPTMGTTRLADRQSNHMRVGQALALLGSARAYLHETADELMAALAQGPVPPNHPAALNSRLAGANAAQSCVQAVDLMYTAAGSSAIYEGHRIERCVRDIRMITQHMGVAPSNFEGVGATMLGFEGPQMGR
jgi:indole-3-acetate monooxygenase